MVRALFVIMGEDQEVYTVNDFTRVATFLNLWVLGPALTPVGYGCPPYPMLIPERQYDYSVTELISSFEDMVANLGPNFQAHSAMCK